MSSRVRELLQAGITNFAPKYVFGMEGAAWAPSEGKEGRGSASSASSAPPRRGMRWLGSRRNTTVAVSDRQQVPHAPGPTESRFSHADVGVSVEGETGKKGGAAPLRESYVPAQALMVLFARVAPPGSMC